MSIRLRPRALVAAVSAVLLPLLVIGIVTMLDAEKNLAHAGKYKYPEARKGDVVDDYWGTKVADPYRWLEDPESEETLHWVDQENALTRQYVDSYPGRAAIEKRLTELWDYPRFSLPTKHGDRYFFYKNDGLQNQAVLYVQATLDGEARVVIDPNKLSEDGTVALSGEYFSDDGKLLAYGISKSGSDQQKIKVRSVDTGEDYPDALEWCKFTSVGWKKDNSGFWYNRFPAKGEVPDEDLNNYNRVYWHALGEPQSSDVLVLSDDARKEVGFWPGVTHDGDYLVLMVYEGTDPRNGFYYRRTDSDGDFVRLMEINDAKYEFIDNVGTIFYFETDLDASRGRVIAVDISNPARANWKEVIPQGDDVIDNVSLVNDELVVSYIHDAHHRLSIYDRDGNFQREIKLPTIGSVAGLSGRREDTEMFFEFTSFVYPTTAFRYDFETDKVSVFRESEVDFDASQYVTEQVFYKSKDGTKIPMFLTYKKGMKRDGKNPTWLYGYGGFNISLTPGFRVSRLPWLENGGIYAVANLRGGDEYGEDWHQQGILDRKQNVFDDFIAAAEYLIAEKYTSTPKLFINGGSNGGLLTAACMLQRPDLFGAVVCQVPVIDMLRYQKFTVGRYWVSDYGNAEDSKEAFDYLYAYSPLHNIKKGTSYPPTLVTSADTDDRVVPSHAKKFVATLQATDSGKNPILLRVETKAGHGGGKPTTKIIEELSDIYAFIYKTMGLDVKS